MNVLWFFVLFLSAILEIQGQSVRLVRLVDHTSYAVSIIQKTMSEVERRAWCNLKIDDMVFTVNDTVLGEPILADVELKNGFVISIQTIDIVQSTIQQVWMPVRDTQWVEIRSTMRMLNVAIGFDVIVTRDGQSRRSTGRVLYPEIQFPFNIIRHLFTEKLTVEVRGSPIRNTNHLEIVPANEVTRVFSILYDWNCTATSINRWATDIFQPITLRLATEEIDFPTICYDCPVT